MKLVKLTYHEEFPATPVSGWAGASWRAWIKQSSDSGQPKRPKQIAHPFLSQRKLWCLLHLQFDGVGLRFATPREIDHVVDVLSKNPLPSGHSLVPGVRLGRPNSHWLSRLPSKAKSLKFRKRLCGFLMSSKDVKKFREFYAHNPVEYDFPHVFSSYWDAHRATYN